MSEKEIEPVVPEEEIELVSKSELKREMHAMQELAERLVGLKPQIWEQFVFSDIMKDALEESLRIKSRNAMRRHVRRLAKLLVKEDSGQVTDLFRRMDEKHLQDNRRFHLIELWRDRLLEEGDKALGNLLDICPNADRQHLRQLIRAGQNEIERGKPPAAQRKLFKYLKELDID
jgi:ribosome-associated protein